MGHKNQNGFRADLRIVPDLQEIMRWNTRECLDKGRASSNGEKFDMSGVHIWKPASERYRGRFSFKRRRPLHLVTALVHVCQLCF